VRGLYLRKFLRGNSLLERSLCLFRQFFVLGRLFCLRNILKKIKEREDEKQIVKMRTKPRYKRGIFK